jgi:hypothetical protein
VSIFEPTVTILLSDAAQEALRVKGIDAHGATVAPQGFEKVGYWAAVACEQMEISTPPVPTN